MKILITGTTGFVGSHLARCFSSAGHEVLGTTRRASAEKPAVLSAQYTFDLHRPELSFPLEGSDAVVHAAHDFSSGAGPANVAGTFFLAQQAARAGVRRQIFISSYSARPDAVTEYGQTKYELEQRLGNGTAVIVRPGLVIGSGGLFRRIAHMVQALPIVPMLNGGRGELPVVSIRDLAQSLLIVAAAEEPQAAYNLFNDQQITLREMVLAIERACALSRILLPIPACCVIPPLEFIGMLGLRLPVDINNVRAFIHNQRTPFVSDLAELIGAESTLEIMVREALNESR